MEGGIELGKILVCNNCGKTIKETDLFCSNCGKVYVKSGNYPDSKHISSSKEENEKEKDNKKSSSHKKKRKIIFWCIVIVLWSYAIVLSVKYFPMVLSYKQALNSLNERDYDEAINIFEELGDFNDSQQKRKQAFYQKARSLMDNGDYDEAIRIYTSCAYSDSQDMIREATFEKANACCRNGDFEKAILLYRSIIGYKDSENKLHSAEYEMAVNAYKNGEYGTAMLYFEATSGYISDDGMYSDSVKKKYEEIIQNASVGDWVFFGTYRGCDISWRVLAKEGTNKVLLISKQAIQKREYEESAGPVTWEECSLRTWLNGCFYDEAFNEAEQAIIQSTNVSSDINPMYMTNSGNETTDRIFLLGINEVTEYLGDDIACRFNGEYCSWWLRTPGYTLNSAAYVSSTGIAYGGEFVYYDCYVRPALWINLDQ